MIAAILAVALAAVVAPAGPPAALRGCGPSGDYDIRMHDDYEKGCVAAMGSRVVREGGDIVVTLDDGTVKRLVPTTDPKTGEATEAFTPVAYEPNAHAIVLTTYAAFVVVDARTGREQHFAAFPFYAPGGAFALTIDAETAALTIFDTNVAPPKEAWRDAPPGHQKPFRNFKLLAWDGDRRARLLVEDYAIAFLVRDAAGAWHYDTIALDELVVDDPPTCMPAPGKKDEDVSGCLAKLDGLAIGNGRLLSLRLADGDRKRFVADLRESWGTYTTYALEGFDPRNHAYVVHTGYYEGTGNMMLVDSRTGSEFDLGDGAQVPFFSPDGKHFVYGLSGDEENNLSGTELHLWSWGPKPKEIWSNDLASATYQIDTMTGWDGDKRFGLRLVDGRTATVSQDDKGAWHYQAIGTPHPPKSAEP